MEKLESQLKTTKTEVIKDGKKTITIREYIKDGKKFIERREEVKHDK